MENYQNKVINLLNTLESELLRNLFYKEFDKAENILKKENSLLKPKKTVDWLLDEINLKKFTPSISKKLLSKNMTKNIDIAMLEPLRIEDYSIKELSDLKDGDYCAIKGIIHSINRTKKVFSVTLNCDGSFIFCNWFRFTPYIRKLLFSLKISDEIVCLGQIKKSGFKWNMNHPKISKALNFKEEKKIVYPSIHNMKNSSIKKVVDFVLALQPKKPYDYLPYTLIVKNRLLLLSELIEYMHKKEKEDKVRQRLKYEELFFLILALRLQESTIKNSRAPLIYADKNFLNKACGRLKFELTNSQKKVLSEIFEDFRKGKPMLRLLQGDVGCGKTIVALLSMLIAVKNGYQVAFMAPTQPLGLQVYYEANRLFEDYGINVELLLSSTKNKQHIYNRIKNGETQVVVGTHALLQDDVVFNNLGFIVVDEQHRFGVEQRKNLMNKGVFPHVLIMSATPIPRSLSMVLYSRSSLSTIVEKPKERKKIKTLHFYNKNRRKAYELVYSEIKNGHQAYIVAPLIDESENIKEVENAVKLYEELKSLYFKEFRVELLHGRLKTQEKDDIIKKFKNGEIDCLVSTTVIEVGIDSPFATVIVVESAERFGLSQLHQLRGRVGRSNLQSYALLVTSDNLSDTAKQRIDAMLSTDDGFKIAELDYKLRGSGEIMGIKQHGHGLVYTDIFEDRKLAKTVKDDVDRLINMGYPINEGLMKMIEYKWQSRINYVYVG